MTLLRAREGHWRSPDCLIPLTVAYGLRASTQGKEKMNREVGQLGVSWCIHAVRRRYTIWHVLLSDVRRPPISTYHPGKLLVDKTVPESMLLGYMIC